MIPRKLSSIAMDLYGRSWVEPDTIMFKNTANISVHLQVCKSSSFKDRKGTLLNLIPLVAK